MNRLFRTTTVTLTWKNLHATWWRSAAGNAIKGCSSARVARVAATTATALAGSYAYSVRVACSDSMTVKESASDTLLSATTNPPTPLLDAKVIFVLGGPGVGKGTQCARLVAEYGCVHLSAGDLLRMEQDRPGSAVGALIRVHIREGTIVPMHVTIGLLRAEMATHSPGTVFLIDGFPRKLDQAWEFEADVAPSTRVLVFECPESVMLERLLTRAQTSRREDDNIESIKKRFRVFNEVVLPVIDYYDAYGKVRRISCVGDQESVYKATRRALEGIVPLQTISSPTFTPQASVVSLPTTSTAEGPASNSTASATPLASSSL